MIYSQAIITGFSGAVEINRHSVGVTLISYGFNPVYTGNFINRGLEL